MIRKISVAGLCASFLFYSLVVTSVAVAAPAAKKQNPCGDQVQNACPDLKGNKRLQCRNKNLTTFTDECQVAIQKWDKQSAKKKAAKQKKKKAEQKKKEA